ncbi:hypothetical protein ACOIC6_27510, partial [Klebsiella pneumoniae]|uniref:hypothetical protein n=1 Tax=Klebsiella pneumoniae TaxID=573 RepID=UPI003B58BF9A
TTSIHPHTNTTIPPIPNIIQITNTLQTNHPKLYPKKPQQTNIPNNLNKQFTIKNIHNHTFPNHHKKRDHTIQQILPNPTKPKITL